MDVSSTKTIEDLPTELMLQIFGYLDYDSIKVATLVNKTWNELISSSADFLKRTRMRIGDGAKTYPFYISRKYRNVNLNDLGSREFRREMFQIGADLGTNLRKLTLYLHYRHKSENGKPLLLNLVRHCVNIEKLTVGYFNSPRKHQIGSEPIVKMSSLKTLKVYNFDWILEYIECGAKLQSLKICGASNQKDGYDQEHIVKFINGLTELSTLELIETSLESQVELSPKFQWKHLTISFVPPTASASSTLHNYMNLLGSAAPNAEMSLVCIRNSTILAKIMKTLGDFHRINRLEIYLDDLPDLEIFHLNNALYGTMKHITSLKMILCTHINYDTTELVKWFISLFTNLKMIHLASDNSLNFNIKDLIPTISEISSTKHLKIELDFFEEVHGDDIPIVSNIETIEVDFCISDDYYCVHDSIAFFGRRHTTLRRLIINLTDQLQSVDNFMRRLPDQFPSVQIFEVRHRVGIHKQVKMRHEIAKMNAASTIEQI